MVRFTLNAQRTTLHDMTRLFAVVLSLFLVAGCASLPSISAFCVQESVAVGLNEQASTQAPASRICTTARSWQATTIGSVQTTRGQTRTVGVPAGFLVAMIVLILLVSLV